MNFAARNILIFPLVILTPFLAWYFLSSETPAPVLPSKVDVVEQKTPVVPTPSAVDQGLEEPAFETPRAFARITGTVRRSDTKAPISNYKIVLLDEVPRSSAQWTAILGIDGSDAGSFGKPKYKWRSIESANGRFQLDDIPSDQPVALGVKAKGFDSVYRAIPAIEGASTLDGIDFLLDPPTGMEGYITTSDGKPIKGVGIYVGQNTYGRVLDRTDDKGYFRVIGLAGESIDIFIYHGDFLPLTSRVFLTRHAIVSLTLALNSGGTVTGMVRKDDESVPGVELVLSDSDQTIKVRRTDREGRFKLAGLPAGAFELTAKAPGSGNGASQTVKRLVEVVDGHETQVDFEVPSEKSSLSGEISIGGIPAKGGLIDAKQFGPDGVIVTETQVQADGIFQIERAVPGTIHLEVVARLDGGGDRFRRLTIDLEEGEHRFETIAFDGDGQIQCNINNLKKYGEAVFVLFEGSEPIDVDDISQQEDVEKRIVQSTAFSENGLLQFNHLESGKYTLAILPPDGAFAVINGEASRFYSVNVQKETTTRLEIDF